MSGITAVFGTAGFNPGTNFEDQSTINEIFDILEQNGCKNLDTAALYGESEAKLGQAKASSRFTIDTKAKGGFGGPGNAKKDNVVAEAKNSRERLGTTVDVYYLHAPDSETPLEQTLEAINEVYKSGFFKRFGLSNFKAEDVEKAYDICKEKGYPLPQVYQGNYNAFSRKQEELLFPTLRKLGMSFYAYSPTAGGFLTKTKEDITSGKGRFDPSTQLGGLYSALYSKDSLLDALAKWAAIADEEGVSRADLANRWVAYNSPLSKEHGDAIIIGASRIEQVKQTLAAVNAGPLSDKAVKGIDELWKTIEKDAPLDNYHR